MSLQSDLCSTCSTSRLSRFCTSHKLRSHQHLARRAYGGTGLFSTHHGLRATSNGEYGVSSNHLTGIWDARAMQWMCNAIAVDSAETGEEKGKKHKVSGTAAASPSSDLERLHADVVIIGAGVIGLSLAHQLLSTTTFSVALIDAAKPCAGATGAGQGYVWLGHKSPKITTWALSKRSNFLWDEFAQGLQEKGLDPLMTIGYKKTGSLLFGTSPEHALALQERAEALCKAGVGAEFLDSTALRSVEPELDVGTQGCAVFTFDDCQIDAHLAVSYITRENRKFSMSGRYTEIFFDPATEFLWSDQHACITGVRTTRREIYCNERVVMAAGAWSGDLMQSIFKKLSLPLVLATKPRKGHLLVLEGLSQISLRHGLMEFAYEKLADSSDPFGIASTATMDAQGRLLLGSSRQFAGFDFSLQYDVMESILKKAIHYLPVLRNTHLAEALSAGNVRIGHRPHVPDGCPMIGPVPELEGLLLATGHEGEGLSLALATAEMVVNLLLGKEHYNVDPTPFSPAGRLAT